MAAIVQQKFHIRKLVIIMILASGTHASMMAQAAFPLGDWTYQGIQHLEQASPEQLTALGAKAVVSGSVTNYSLPGMNFRFNNAGGLKDITLTMPDRTVNGHRDLQTAPPLPAWFGQNCLSWNSSYREMALAMEKSPDFDVTIHSNGGVSLGNINPAVLATRGRTFYAHLFATCLANPGVYLNIDFRGPVVSPGQTLVTIDSSASLASISFNLPASPQKSRSKVQARRETIIFDTERRFALGLAGILSTQNRSKFETLETDPLGGKTAQDQRELLLRDWGIHDHDDLLDMCRKLNGPGIHGLAWLDMLALLDSDSDATPLEIIDRNHLGNRRAAYLLFAAANRDLVDERGIDAWDLGRAVSLARWGYTAEYLSQEEAWGIIMPIWERVRLQYKSWEDWAYHYILGRSFWAAGFNQDAQKLSDALISWHTLQYRPDTIWQTAWPAADSLDLVVRNPDSIGWNLNYASQPWMTMMSAWDNLSQKPSLAVQQMDKARSLASDCLMLAINQVNFSVSSQKLPQALEQAKALVERWPADPAAWSCLGSVQNNLDLPSDAMQSWKTALGLDANWFDALAGYASSLVQTGKAQESLAWFDRALARMPAGSGVDEYPNLYFQHAWALNRTGRFALAMPILEALAKSIPGNASIQFQLGLSYVNQGTAFGDRALKAFEAAEALKYELPQQVKAWMQEWRNRPSATAGAPVS